jgi:hypothetical protein
MDGSIAHAPSIKPTVREGIAGRHARDLADIRNLKARVLDAVQLSGDLIDFGAGNRNRADELEGLLNSDFAFTSCERADIQAGADSHGRLALACRDELAALPAWSDRAKLSSWKELAQEAARREAIA